MRELTEPRHSYTTRWDSTPPDVGVADGGRSGQRVSILACRCVRVSGQPGLAMSDGEQVGSGKQAGAVAGLIGLRQRGAKLVEGFIAPPERRGGLHHLHERARGADE